MSKKVCTVRCYTRTDEAQKILKEINGRDE